MEEELQNFYWNKKLIKAITRTLWDTDGFNRLNLSYVYTRRGPTSIIDATAWGGGIKYRGAIYTRRDVAMI